MEKIQFGYIIGKDIDIDADNSVIEIKHIKTESLMPLLEMEEF